MSKVIDELDLLIEIAYGAHAPMCNIHKTPAEAGPCDFDITCNCSVALAMEAIAKHYHDIDMGVGESLEDMHRRYDARRDGGITG